jgi:response regulator RpfG family c-di-GMP phosphodiesterase
VIINSGYDQGVIFSDQDLIALRDDEQETQLPEGYWKILVVDDEESVHSITKIILKDFQFENRILEIFDAYSEEEARYLIRQHPDIAVILLDVVMKEDDSGLKFIQYVRDELKKKLVRIILRTGQPGQAPERRVIVDYDINDYKLKSEITADQLFVSVLTALRSYRDLIDLEESKNGLEKVIKSSAELYKSQSFKNLTSNILFLLNWMMEVADNAVASQTSSLAATKKNDGFYIEAATGEYRPHIGAKLEDILPARALKAMQRAISLKKTVFNDDSFISYFQSSLGAENIIYTKSHKDFNKLKRDLIEIFCSNIAVAFDNFYLKEEVNTAQKEIIFTLGEIAESKSAETGFHVKRVAEYSKQLALKAGLPEAEAETISIASTMHDVGKLIIADSILNKPGKLTAAEFEQIKTHTTFGYDMLKQSNGKVMKIASLISLQHHEKYDGSGYPNGLKGEAIDLCARIVTLADVFDALASKRVYKEPWELGRIVELFEHEGGKHFDPGLVSIFLEQIDRMVHIKNSFPD